MKYQSILMCSFLWLMSLTPLVAQSADRSMQIALTINYEDEVYTKVYHSLEALKEDEKVKALDLGLEKLLMKKNRKTLIIKPDDGATSIINLSPEAEQYNLKITLKPNYQGKQIEVTLSFTNLINK